MFGISFDELILLSVVVGIPLLVALAVFIPSAGSSARRPPAGEVDLVQEWASVHDAWRDGDLLVVRSGASLPNRCILTNQPGDRWISLRMYWHPPALYLAIFGGLWLYVVLALLLRQRLDVDVAIAEEVLARRRLALWGSVTVGVAGFAVTFVSAGNPETLWGAAGLFMVIGAMAVWVWGGRLVRAVRIESGFAWLKGAHPDYLMTLPAFGEIHLEPVRAGA